MNTETRNLDPRAIWNYFADINAIPRASKKEEKITAFMKQFGHSLGLDTMVDATGNVIIKKPASAGMENKQTVVLQSHLDMVHQKNANIDFDFSTQGIQMYVDGDWVKAKGTTLGADNGIGVATMMSILASGDIPHPPIEALFTVDEETGMTGAKELKAGLLNGKILLNLDTEDDDELTIGCAGGMDVTIDGNYPTQPPVPGSVGLLLSLTGLTGGHSGVDIQLGRANANKLMNRVLFELQKEGKIEIHAILGGSLRNAIPRESKSVITATDPQLVKEEIEKWNGILKAKYRVTDPLLVLTVQETEMPAAIFETGFQQNFLAAVYACPNGIYRMTPGIDGLVQTSNNIAKIEAADEKFSVQCLTRSSVDTEKKDLATAIQNSFIACQGKVSFTGEYPGWEPKPDDPVIKMMSDLYQKMFLSPARVDAIHAGLECGIIGGHYPVMQMISLGPNIYGAHSPDERVQISSVQKFWKFLLEILKQIPDKQ